MLPYRNPLGYKSLLTWKQACEIFELTERFCATLPTKNPKTGQYTTDLKDQMIRSARSGVRNIEEGFSRSTTKEYISFLGFSKGSLEELLGDFNYCLRESLGDRKMAERAVFLLKGEGKMLHNQTLSLQDKMIRDKTLSANDAARLILEKQRIRQEQGDKWLAEQIRMDKEKQAKNQQTNPPDPKNPSP